MEANNHKILAPEAAARQVRYWQQQGYDVVFTNGCFDILHTGHVRYLASSAKLGDRLIVALNDDASVRRLKGASRPVNHLEDRMEVMAALSYVDAVTWFPEDTPFELISALTPDIITKGGDYTPQSVIGADIVTEKGGRVEIIRFEKGYSSTSILDRSR